MTEETDTEYYQRREFQALTMCETAIAPHIQAIHRELAAQYALLITECTSGIGKPSCAWSDEAH